MSRYLPLAILSVFLSAGCTPEKIELEWPAPRPLGREVPSFKAPREPIRKAAFVEDFEEYSSVLNLQQALELALLRNPELAASSWRARAGEARVLQAGLPPNPELEAEVEEFGGTRNRGNFEGAEASIRISQVLELAGKRKKRARAAALDRDAAGWDYEGKRLEILTAATRAFYTVLAAQERLAIAGEMLRLAGQVHDAVAERVEAGKVSPLEESKAKIPLAESRIEFERAERALESSRRRLSALWGSTSPAFSRAEGRFEEIREIPPLERLLPAMLQNPELVRRRIEVDLQEAALDLENARSVPDLTITAGMQRFYETDDQAFILGFSIPLPFFDRNQGLRLEARHRVAAALEEERAAKIRIRIDLERAYRDLDSFRLEAIALRNEVVPASSQAFDAAREGYLQGKFGYLEVLDAQRTFFEAHDRFIQVLASYHEAAAELEHLIGMPLELAVEPASEEQSHEN